jgi:hypothetical protein
MKTSVVTSAVLHGLVLAAALVSIGSPEHFKVDDFEAMPVDLVPVESITQMQQGDKKAPMKETSAPKPTTRPPTPDQGENVGDNKVDLKTTPVPNAKPSNTDAAAANSSEKPAQKIDPIPNEVKEVNKEETEVEQPKEVASIPQTKPDVAPTPPKPEEKPVEEAKPEEAPKPDAEALPDKVPTPVAKPQVKPPEEKQAEKPPEKPQDQPKTAEKPTDKKKDDQKREVAKSASSMKSDFNADDIAALLNKTDPSAGGTKRSTQEASLGAKKATQGASKLSMSEMDALKSAIAGNWNVIPGMEGMNEVRIKVHMKLDEDGNIVGQPEVEATGGDNDSTRRALAGGAYRAIMKSAPFSTLPKDKYDAWNEVVVNFDPSDLGI